MCLVTMPCRSHELRFYAPHLTGAAWWRSVPALVRLGVHDSLHPAVRGLHIDVLAERQAAKGATSLESLAGEVVGVH